MIYSWVIHIAFILLGLSAFLCIIRFLKGPSLSDRLIAFDLLAIIGAATMVLLALVTEVLFFFDSVLIWSLLAFLGTAAFARYLEKKALR